MDIVIRFFQQDGGASDELTREQMEDCCYDFLEEFSNYYPRLILTLLNGTGGDITLPSAQQTALAAWGDATTWIDYIESELDEDDPEDEGLLMDGDYVLYPLRSTSATTIKFPSGKDPDSGTSNVRLAYWAMHTIDDGSLTIPSRQLRRFANGATAYCHGAASAKYAAAISERLSGDSTNFPRLRDAHQAMADYRWNIFMRAVKPKDEDLEAAMEQATAVPPPSHRGAWLWDSWGRHKGTRGD